MLMLFPFLIIFCPFNSHFIFMKCYMTLQCSESVTFVWRWSLPQCSFRNVNHFLNWNWRRMDAFYCINFKLDSIFWMITIGFTWSWRDKSGKSRWSLGAMKIVEDFLSYLYYLWCIWTKSSYESNHHLEDGCSSHLNQSMQYLGLLCLKPVMSESVLKHVLSSRPVCNL